MAAAGLPDQARLAFQGRADASLDELLPCCTIKRRAEDFVVDEIDEDGQRASEAMTRAPEATLRAALEDLAAKLDARQQQPAADVDESDGEDALSALDEATLDALRAFDGAAKDQVLGDGVGAAPMSVALPDGGNRLNLRLALEKGFPWTRVRLESGAVETDLRLKPLATILSADDVERLQRFGRTRGSKAAATIDAPADKDARRAVHTTLAAAFRACETKTLECGTISARWRGGRKRRRDGPRWPLVVRCVLEKRNAEAFAVINCVEINQRVGCSTPSSRRRVDGVEVDATVQHTGHKSRRPPPGPARGRARDGRGQGPPRGDAPVPDRGFGQVARRDGVPRPGARRVRRRRFDYRRRDAVAVICHRAGAQRRPVAGQRLPAPRFLR